MVTVGDVLNVAMECPRIEHFSRLHGDEPFDLFRGQNRIARNLDGSEDRVLQYMIGHQNALGNQREGGENIVKKTNIIDRTAIRFDAGLGEGISGPGLKRRLGFFCRGLTGAFNGDIYDGFSFEGINPFRNALLFRP